MPSRRLNPAADLARLYRPSQLPNQQPRSPWATAEPSVASADAVPPVYSTFTQWEKRLIVLGASIAAFFSPLTGQIYLPALNVIAQDFNITASQVNLTVTTYLIFQGVTPMFVGGFADTAGRRPAYVICFVIYILSNIGLALSKNYASLMVVRCIQSAGSSSTVALCQAVMSDVVTSAERGQYIGITVIPVILGPSLGPVIGGLLSQYLGWRAIFWFLAIAAAVVFVLLVLFLPETCRIIVDDGSVRPHPFYRTLSELLKDAYGKRKAKKVGAGNNLQRTVSASTPATSKAALKIQWPNPLNSVRLIFQKEIGLLLAYTSIVVASFYAIATAIPSQFAAVYGFDDLRIGLMYLPMAGGSIVAAFVMGPAINWNYRRHARKLGLPVDKSRQQDLSNFPIERARLEIGLPLALLSSIVVLCWGWALEKHASIAVPCVLLFLLGVGMIGFGNTANVLLVDVSPGRTGAAVAANNLTRCVLGAGFSAFIVPLIEALGAGWAFFLIGMLYIVCSPALFLIMAKGIDWRRELHEKDERRNEKRQQRQQEMEKRRQDKTSDHQESNLEKGQEG